ncbi:MAG TPA: hypothetical protein PKC43_03405 [Phycisphaerales bacterium]|nr:hypothetical protein [Phycisphaerales bacterium]HMP36476.1 hypothetical protein [Phycisphaerales bacterium]
MTRLAFRRRRLALLPRTAAASCALLTAGLLLPAILGGCESAAVRAQDAGQKEIDRVAAEFAALNALRPAAGDDDAGARRRQELRGLANRLAGLRDLAPGQQGSANLLAAGVFMAIGQSAADDAAMLARRLRDDRRQLDGRIEATNALRALAIAGDSYDPTADRAALESLRREAREQIATLDRLAAELTTPMARLSEEIVTSRAAAAEVERQEIDLRQQARAAGPTRGFRYVEEASRRRTEADGLRMVAARSEIELMAIAPDRELAEVDAEQLRGIVEQIDAAEGDLTAATSEARRLAEAARNAIAETRAAIAGTVRSIASLEQGLDALVEEADAAFQQAAASAQRATSVTEPRALGSAARRSVASAYQAAASLHAGRAMTLRDDASQLRRVAGFGELLDDGAITARLDVVEQARTASVGKAIAAATQALEQVGMFGSESPESAALRENLAAMIDSLSGRAVATASQGGAGSSQVAAPTEGGGAASPQDLLAMLRAIDFRRADDHRAIVRLYRGSGRDARSALRMLQIGGEDCGAFGAAMVDRFGIESIAASYGGMSVASDFGHYEVGDVEGTRGTLAPTEPGLGEIPIISARGRWYIDLDATLAAESAEVRASLSQMSQMLQGAEAMRPVIREVCEAMAARVRSGEFSSAEEATMAYSQALMERMLGGAGVDVEAMMREAAKALEGMSEEDLRRLQEQFGDQLGRPR